MMSAEERYKEDPTFKMMVDQIYLAVERKQYTPTEVRDAAMLASLMYEMRHIRPLILRKGGLLEEFR